MWQANVFEGYSKYIKIYLKVPMKQTNAMKVELYNFLQFLMNFEPRVLQTGEYCLGWTGPWSSISIPAKLG